MASTIQQLTSLENQRMELFCVDGFLTPVGLFSIYLVLEQTWFRHSVHKAEFDFCFSVPQLWQQQNESLP